MSEFKVGDVVYHKSRGNDGPKMIIVGVQGDMVECEWINEKGEVQRDKFLKAALSEEEEWHIL